MYGTTQKLQYLLQPSMIDTKALPPSTRAGGRWSNFSISGKMMSTCGWPLARRALDQLRQPMQRLRAEYEIDIRRARDDRGALLARDAAAHADNEVRAALLFRCSHAPQIVKHFFLRFFAHRARVEEDHVGVFGVAAATMPCAAFSTSAILAESYSFIWQPKVLM